MEVGDGRQLRKIVDNILRTQDPIMPHIAAHVDQICHHHREHRFSDITIGIILAINEIQHTHNTDDDATTELIWRLIYACAQMERIRP